MSPPSWVKKRQYKRYNKTNGSVNLVHFSPNGKKTVVHVPKTNSSNIPSFLKKHYGLRLPPTWSVRRMNKNKVNVVHGKIAWRMPINNPSDENIMKFIARKQMIPFNRHVNASNFFKKVTSNGKTGTALTTMNTKGVRTVYNVTKGPQTHVHIGIGKLGGGEQASVYLGYKDPACTRAVSIKVFPVDLTLPPNKQAALTEYEIGRKVHEVAPVHTPRYDSIERTVLFVPDTNLQKLSGLINTKKQFVIFSEYFHGGDLRNWMKKVESRLTDEILLDIARQVLSTILTIRKKYPMFRHNDMHSGNIFVDDTGNSTRFAIGDFGMSKLTDTLMSNEVKRGNFLKDDIGPNVDERFDAHFFLNSLTKYATQFPKFRRFLSVAVPTEYRGRDTPYIKNGRLRYGIQYPGLPSTEAMLHILTPRITEKNLQNALASKKTEASNIARNLLAKTIPNVTITNWGKVSPKTFMKLTPKRRALVAAARKARPVTTKAPSPTRFPKKNVTKRTRTNVHAYVKMVRNMSPKTYNLNRMFRTPAKTVLNKYRNSANQVTVKNLTKVLTNKGYTPARAKKNARNWVHEWIDTTGKRRMELQLVRRPDGRIAKGRRLLDGYTIKELTNLAKKYKVPHERKTKAELISALWKK